MARKLNKKDVNAVIALAHLPMRDIARKTGVSLGSVHAILAEAKGKPAAKKSRRVKSTRLENAANPAPPPSPPSVASESDEGDELARSMRALVRASELAAEEGSLAHIIGAERAIANLASIQARLAPPPPVDPNMLPDMVALRAEAARKWHEMIDFVADDTGVE